MATIELRMDDTNLFSAETLDRIIAAMDNGDDVLLRNWDSGPKPQSVYQKLCEMREKS